MCAVEASWVVPGTVDQELGGSILGVDLRDSGIKSGTVTCSCESESDSDSEWGSATGSELRGAAFDLEGYDAVQDSGSFMAALHA
eukprot:3276434-Rhodomonas_salina.3